MSGKTSPELPKSPDAGHAGEETTHASSIFILKANPGSLRAVETYLRNRDWEVGAGTQMREVLAYIIQKKPKLVMIPSDHPNKKVKILPKLLAQAFPVKIIAYCESASASALVGLRDLNLPYMIYPPVSGTQVERLWLRMLKDEEQALLQKQRQDSGEIPAEGDTESVGSDGIIRLRGASNKADHDPQSFESARAALQQLVNSKDDDEAADPASIAQTGNRTEKSGVHVNKGATAPRGPAYMGGADTKGKMHSENQDGPGEGESFAEWEERLRKQLAYKTGEQEGAGEKPGHFNPQSGSSEEQTGLGIESGKTEEPSHYNPQTGLIEPGLNPNESAKSEPMEPDYDTGARSRLPKRAPVMEFENVVRKKKSTLFIRGEARDSSENENIVVKGAVEALDSSVASDFTVSDEDDSQVAKIERTSNAACITVDSPRFSGYLVAVLGANRQIDKAFIDTIKKRLYAFLKANGEAVTEDEAQGVKLQEVAFEDWALEQAEFLKKSVHGSEEIAMAFFPNKEVAAKLESSASEKMVQMPLDELKEDVALEFDLYIYMPENNKYLLYTPQGKPLQGKQKSRLHEKGVTHMHLRKDSIAEVKRYRAQNFLNDKIEAFKLAKKSKPS